MPGERDAAEKVLKQSVADADGWRLRDRAVINANGINANDNATTNHLQERSLEYLDDVGDLDAP